MYTIATNFNFSWLLQLKAGSHRSEYLAIVGAEHTGWVLFMSAN